MLTYLIGQETSVKSAIKTQKYQFVCRLIWRGFPVRSNGIGSKEIYLWKDHIAENSYDQSDDE